MDTGWWKAKAIEYAGKSAGKTGQCAKWLWKTLTSEGIVRNFKTHFTAGILVVVPLAITTFILLFLYRKIDGLLAPYIQRLLGMHIPFLGFLLTFLIIYLVGMITSSLLGRKLFKTTEGFVSRMPFLKSVYTVAKELVQSIMGAGKKAFQKVVIVEYPRKGIRCLAFLAGHTVDKSSGERLATVFIPTSPNPTSGMMEILPESEIVETDMNVELAMKVIISGGVLVPPELGTKSKRESEGQK